MDVTPVNAFKGRLERRRRPQVQSAIRLLIHIYQRLVTTRGRLKRVQLHMVSNLVSYLTRGFFYGETYFCDTGRQGARNSKTPATPAL